MLGGAIIGLKDGDNSFARLETYEDAGVAVSGLWCEDWVGLRVTSFGNRLFWDWQWNAERYPDLPARIAELKARGIRFLGYVNPYLAVDGPLYAEAVSRGFLVMRPDCDEPYVIDFGEFCCGHVDFTNPAAAAWFADTIIGEKMIDFGLSGWMADFGEYLPVDVRLANGERDDRAQSLAGAVGQGECQGDRRARHDGRDDGVHALRRGGRAAALPDAMGGRSGGRFQPA